MWRSQFVNVAIATEDSTRIECAASLTSTIATYGLYTHVECCAVDRNVRLYAELAIIRFGAVRLAQRIIVVYVGAF